MQMKYKFRDGKDKGQNILHWNIFPSFSIFYEYIPIILFPITYKEIKKISSFFVFSYKKNIYYI